MKQPHLGVKICLDLSTDLANPSEGGKLAVLRSSVEQDLVGRGESFQLRAVLGLAELGHELGWSLLGSLKHLRRGHHNVLRLVVVGSSFSLVLRLECSSLLV